MAYRRRYLDDELDDLVHPPIGIAIEGPKGVGKTETAQRRAVETLRLDDPAVRQVVAADPDRMLGGPGPLLLDEWQRLPMVWDWVRRAVDAGDDRVFLLTGSATPVAGTDTHSGAGRILSVRLRPMSLPERGVTEPTVRLADLFAGKTDITGDTDWGGRRLCPGDLFLGLPRHPRVATAPGARPAGRVPEPGD